MQSQTPSVKTPKRDKEPGGGIVEGENFTAESERVFRARLSLIDRPHPSSDSASAAADTGRCTRHDELKARRAAVPPLSRTFGAKELIHDRDLIGIINDGQHHRHHSTDLIN